MSNDVHTATLIRLQVVHNALQQVAFVVSDATANLREYEKRLAALGNTDAAAGLTEIRAELATVLALARAAMDIARGARTDVPPELRGKWAHESEMLTRFLEVPAGQSA